MKRLIFASILSAFCAIATHAKAADECGKPSMDIYTADLISKTGAVFERKSPGGNSFLHLGVIDFNIQCGAPYPGIDVDIKMGFPPREFFDIAATAATVLVKAPKAEILAALYACQKAAIKNEGDERAEYLRDKAAAKKRGDPPPEDWTNGGHVDAMKVTNGVIDCVSFREPERQWTHFSFGPPAGPKR